MFDLAIIGGGIAGFSAAITASKLGLKVALIEQHQIGGTCLNIGCIPTKSLFQSAMLVKILSNKENFGFVGVNPKFDWLCFRHNSEIIIKQIRANMVLQLKNAN